MNSDVADNENASTPTKPVSKRTLSHLFSTVEETDGHHLVLTRLMDLLEKEIDLHSKAALILDDLRHLHDEIGANLVDLDDSLGAIEREEHDYFA